MCPTNSLRQRHSVSLRFLRAQRTHQLSELYYYSVTRALTINYVLEIIWEELEYPIQ